MQSLATLRVLVVEDSYLVALAVQTILEGAGAVVACKTGRLATALQFVTENRIDLACLDLNLRNENSIPLADVLAARGTPFIFVTSQPVELIPTRHASRLMVSKPPAREQLIAACLGALPGPLAAATKGIEGFMHHRQANQAETDLIAQGAGCAKIVSE